MDGQPKNITLYLQPPQVGGGIKIRSQNRNIQVKMCSGGLKILGYALKIELVADLLIFNHYNTWAHMKYSSRVHNYSWKWYASVNTYDTLNNANHGTSVKIVPYFSYTTHWKLIKSRNWRLILLFMTLDMVHSTIRLNTYPTFDICLCIYDQYNTCFKLVFFTAHVHVMRFHMIRCILLKHCCHMLAYIYSTLLFTCLHTFTVHSFLTLCHT